MCGDWNINYEDTTTVKKKKKKEREQTFLNIVFDNISTCFLKKNQNSIILPNFIFFLFSFKKKDTVMTLKPDGTFYQKAGNYNGKWSTKG